MITKLTKSHPSGRPVVRDKQAVEHEERLHREAQAEVTRLRKAAIEASQRAALRAQPPPRGVELGDFVA